MGSIHFDLTGNNRDLERKLRESRESIRNVGSTAKQESQMIEQYFKRAAIGVGEFASMDTLKQFGMELIEITGKFQTFEAVLTNTLQSPEKAKSSVMMLQEFAATTPFQVDGLIGAFVKLANQGFVPTYAQMVKLGDLAVSTGKDFDQLAEAIIDAQTGEFERLKEFGIRAGKEGDKVTFIFKEQATQVDFTASSIRDYMLSLGDLKGVQGANAELAKTNDTLAEPDGEFISTSNSVGKGDKSVKSFSEQVQATASEITTLKTKLVELKAGRGESEDFAEDITETDKALEEAQTKYDLLLGIDAKYLKERESVLEKAEKAYKSANDAQLIATEDLYNSDLELKCEQTKDKIELINLNRDAAIAGIEKEKDEYVKLAVDAKTEENKKLGITTEVDKSQIDTSAYDKRITNVTVSAKIDVETATNDAAKEVKDQLEKLKLEFETFEQTRTRITEEYAAKRKAMREEDGVTFKPGFEQGNEDEAMADEKDALDALDLEVAKRETTFNRILDGIVKMGLEELENALFQAQTKLAKADKGGASEKELARLRAEIAALQKQKESEESKSPEERSAEKSKKRWGDTVKVMNDVLQTTDNVISGFDGLDETTKDSLSAATNVAGGIIGMITGIQTLSTMSVEAIKSVEGASVILAIIGAAVQIITAIFNLAGKAEQRHTEALEKINRERVKMQKEYNNLLFEQNMLLKEAVSIFGTDQISKAINSFKLYRDQLDLLKNDMKGEAPNKEDYGGLFDFSKGSFEQAQEDYEKGILGIKQIQIKTGHEKTGLFGMGSGRDIYSSVLDVYDDLVSKEGELNVERANAILSTHELSEEHKSALEQMIDYSENSKKAAEELSSYLEGTFGDLGSSIMNHVVDGVKNGTDAWMEFGKTGAKVLEELGKQIAYELFFSKSFKDLEEQLDGIYGSGGSKLDITNAARDAVTNFYNGIEGQMDAADIWYRQWMDEAENRGIKMGDNVNNENSLTGAIRGSVATEQSVLELGGIFRGQWDSLKRLEGQCERGFRSISDICILQKEIATNTFRTANNTDGLTSKIDATNTKLDEVIKNTKPEKYGR